jgi:hypothetical protein
VLLVWRQHHVVRIGLLVTAFSSRFMEEAFSVVDAEITSSDNNKPAEGLIRNVIRQRKVPGLPEILDADSKAVRRRPLPVVIHSCKQEWSSRCQLEVLSSPLSVICSALRDTFTFSCSVSLRDAYCGFGCSKYEYFVCRGILSQACIPVTLSVKDGLHHDLNARATDDLEGPSFPC